MSYKLEMHREYKLGTIVNNFDIPSPEDVMTWLTDREYAGEVYKISESGSEFAIYIGKTIYLSESRIKEHYGIGGRGGPDALGFAIRENEPESFTWMVEIFQVYGSLKQAESHMIAKGTWLNVAHNSGVPDVVQTPKWVDRAGL